MKRWEIYLDIIMELLVLFVGAFLLIVGIPKCLGFLWPFVAGWIISRISRPVIEYLEKKMKLPKKFGTAILIIAVVTLVIAICYLCVRGLVTQVIAFMNGYQDLQKEIIRQFGSFQQKIGHFAGILPHGAGDHLNQIVRTISNGALNIVSIIGNYGVAHAGGAAKLMTNGLVGIVVMFFSSYMFSIDNEKFVKWYQKVIPEGMKHKIDIFIHNTLGVLGSYCLAQIKIMFIMIFILWAGLWLAGIHYAFIFAILIGIVDILPILGTGIVMIPWALFKLITGEIKTAVIFLVVYLICLILKQILQPKMMGKGMGISAFTTIFLIYIGLKLNGIGGMLLALVVGIFVINLYRLGAFDRKIAFFKRRIEMLEENSEREEMEEK